MKVRFALISIVALLLIAACATASPTKSNNRNTVTVTLSNLKIDSTVTQFAKGVSYHFVIVNKDSTMHEVLIAPPMSDMTDDMKKQALVNVPTIYPNQQREVDYTFTSVAAYETLEFACHIPGHYEAGMKLAISVV